VSRLNSLAARFRSGDESAGSQLNSLQLQLAQVAATLGTCIRVCTGGSTPVMQQYVRGEAVFCSTVAREPGRHFCGRHPKIFMHCFQMVNQQQRELLELVDGMAL